MQSSPMAATALADTTELNTDLVTPGVLGFLVIFVIGLALYFLMRNMTGKLSRVRGEQEEDLAARREEKAGTAVPVDGAAERASASDDPGPEAGAAVAAETGQEAGNGGTAETRTGEDGGAAGR
ncbi:hypothetical protein [Nocardiopsis kunsanensis]|nr:hypothetical protein [Nocardiopsis kunsanensis]